MVFLTIIATICAIKSFWPRSGTPGSRDNSFSATNDANPSNGEHEKLKDQRFKNLILYDNGVILSKNERNQKMYGPEEKPIECIICLEPFQKALDILYPCVCTATLCLNYLKKIMMRITTYVQSVLNH